MDVGQTFGRNCRFFDEEGEEITNKNPDPNVAVFDSIWNFHVWNDVWMARPDLPMGYGGWQAQWITFEFGALFEWLVSSVSWGFLLHASIGPWLTRKVSSFAGNY